jgi:hypothetical protein
MMASQFLTKVEFANFRSIKSCSVTLQPLTFLVGPNGSGKSNSLDGLRFVSDGLRSSLDHAIRERGGIQEVRQRSGGRPTHLSIGLEFQIDSIFFVDLPSELERADVLAIHLSRHRRSPSDYRISELLPVTDGFSGAELQEVVVSALFKAFSEPHRELRTEHLIEAARSIVPLSHSRAAEIDRLREWAAANCRRAALPPELAEKSAPGTPESRRRRLMDL